VRKAGERGHGEAAEVLLDRAAERIAAEKAEDKKQRSQGLPAWAYFILLVMVLGFSIAMFMIPKQTAFMISGWTLFTLSNLALLYFQVRILIVAFSESVTCGLLYLFLPFYSLYYIFTRWDECGGYFLMSIVANVVAGVGQAVVGLGPMMGGDEADATRWNPPPRPVAAVVVSAPAELMETYKGRML
jgi:hypothetical protein